jgi:hypothetical protein
MHLPQESGNIVCVRPGVGVSQPCNRQFRRQLDGVILIVQDIIPRRVAPAILI